MPGVSPGRHQQHPHPLRTSRRLRYLRQGRDVMSALPRDHPSDCPSLYGVADSTCWLNEIDQKNSGHHESAANSCHTRQSVNLSLTMPSRPAYRCLSGSKGSLTTRFLKVWSVSKLGPPNYNSTPVVGILYILFFTCDPYVLTKGVLSRWG